MNIKQQADLISSIEEKFPVDEWVIDGIHVWPIIRMKFAFALSEYFRSSTQSKKGLFKKAFGQINSHTRYLYAYLRDYSKNVKPHKSIDTIFLSDGVSYTKLNGTWYERFCDPFISQFKQEDIKIGRASCRERV